MLPVHLHSMVSWVAKQTRSVGWWEPNKDENRNNE